MWALLALLTAASGQVPPFQLAAMTFAIGGLAGLVGWYLRGTGRAVLRQSWRAWALGVGGLFGYHFLYFTALRNAPPAQASLIAYLWPLLIVLSSARATGERLQPAHLIGAGLAFVGAALVVTGGADVGFQAQYLPGYAIALAAAFVWTGYSVLSRRHADVPTDIVTGFCLVTALFAGLCHLALEVTVWPAGAVQWLAVLGLGLGPVGLAFFAWDIGMKKGDLPLLGAASYAAPLLSTLILIAFGVAEPHWSIALAAALITIGAALAATPMLRQTKKTGW